MNSILKNGKIQNLASKKTQIYAQKPRLKMLIKNSISGSSLIKEDSPSPSPSF
jgi:hypothetical protein